jgi:hypothetical protein
MLKCTPLAALVSPSRQGVARDLVEAYVVPLHLKENA